MTSPMMAESLGLEATPESNELQAVARLLGLRRPIGSRIDAHDMLLQGLQRTALTHLIDNLRVIRRADLEKAVGMSTRTLQRHKGAPARLLSQEQSRRTWKFAEILAKATLVFGTQDEAELWLERPAIGLNRRRPIDLLATPTGVELVEEFLERVRHGVYA